MSLPIAIETDDPRDRREEELLSIIPRDRRRIYKPRRLIELVMSEGDRRGETFRLQSSDRDDASGREIKRL